MAVHNLMRCRQGLEFCDSLLMIGKLGAFDNTAVMAYNGEKTTLALQKN
jgi:hypothetical protein